MILKQPNRNNHCHLLTLSLKPMTVLFILTVSYALWKVLYEKCSQSPEFCLKALTWFSKGFRGQSERSVWTRLNTETPNPEATAGFTGCQWTHLRAQPSVTGWGTETGRNLEYLEIFIELWLCLVQFCPEGWFVRLMENKESLSSAWNSTRGLNNNNVVNVVCLQIV